MEEAIKNSQLSDVVRSLPKGLKTVIGERGIRLSGGQRQRIALARAFYHQRDIIVMDESTSALDSETEKEIVDEIKRLVIGKSHNHCSCSQIVYTKVLRPYLQK